MDPLPDHADLPELVEFRDRAEYQVYQVYKELAVQQGYKDPKVYKELAVQQD